jgi:DNA-binding GntR family transcriptional regulator
VLAEVVAEHERLVDAIESRDAARAVAALTEHLDRSDYASAAELTRDAEQVLLP